ncbi:MAG: DUF3794 domain-containing protein [Lachnospiraceae bacterium]|nr:DUF3794 domain-containing protein [Lachnospiraceae bacterium]
MELITTQIQMERKRGAATAQATFDEVYHLPDYLPDLFSVILTDGDVRVDEVRSGPGHVTVRGGVRYRVLYKTDQNAWKIASLDGEIPFQETLTVEEMDEFDMVRVEPVLEDLSVRISDSRKLNIRALLNLRAEARQRYDLDIPGGVDAVSLPEQRMEEQEFLELRYHGKESCSIREEVRIPSNKPNIRQILWQQAQVFGMDRRLSPGMVGIQGEIQVFVVYAGEESDNLQWFTEKVPFHCEFEIPEADSDLVSCIVAQVQNLSCSAGSDEDGEARMVLAEAVLLADIRVYEEQKREILRDAYALDRDLVLHKNQVVCSGLRMKNESACRVNDTIRIQGQDSDILQICAGFGAEEMDRVTCTEEGIQVEGIVRICILYLTASDNTPVEAMEGVLPFSHLIEIPGLRPDDDVALQHSLQALSFLMKSSREAEIQAVVRLEAMAAAANELECITQIEETDLNPEAWRAQPSMVGLTLRPGDSLWDIAKQYRTTVSEIRNLNHLEADPVSPGKKILLMKQLPGRG